MRFAWRLRRRRFDRAVVLADSGRGDVGYGEAKFWALISRARRREWGGQSLSLLSEARAKKPLLPLFFVRAARTLSKIKGIRPRDDAPWRGAQTFVYLQHATQRGLQSGRVLLLGGEWDEAAARRCGWQAVASESAETLSLILCDAQCPAELLARLEPGGLLCCRAGAPSGWRVLEERPAFFQPEARDVWLVHER